MTARNEYKQQKRSQIDELEAQIEELMAQTTEASYDEYLTDIRIKQENAKAKLAQLKEAEDEAGQNLRAELEEAVRDVQNALFVAGADSRR
jgi:hypothetical protein